MNAKVALYPKYVEIEKANDDPKMPIEVLVFHARHNLPHLFLTPPSPDLRPRPKREGGVDPPASRSEDPVLSSHISPLWAYTLHQTSNRIMTLATKILLCSIILIHCHRLTHIKSLSHNSSPQITANKTPLSCPKL